jgi:hypothetical protein
MLVALASGTLTYLGAFRRTKNPAVAFGRNKSDMWRFRSGVLQLGLRAIATLAVGFWTNQFSIFPEG